MSARKTDDIVAVVVVPRLLSVASAAEVLSCSEQTIRRRVHSGELPAIKDNGRMMIRGDELRAFIDARERFAQPRGRRSRKTPTAGEFDWLREP